uniref:Inhibitor of apoptosis-like protein n=1 Tax=Zea mays TaxID=4577 RepID=B6TZ68_MAIZE|nr:inhibitor of apoptosis-like protein [Zea mays]
MAVQAQHLFAPAFLPHDVGHALRALEGAAAVGGSALLDELGLGGCAPAPLGDAAFGDARPRSELTCNAGDDNSVFLPRKRARVVPGFLLDEVQNRCGAASTSGRAMASGVLSQLYHQGVEVDALVRVEMDRMRAALHEARLRHARAVVAAVRGAAEARLRTGEAELERARRRGAELEERLRQLAAEGQAWLGVARSHEAVAAGLRATLDKVLQQPAVAGGGGGECGEAEDAQSCCFVASPSGPVSTGSSPSCKACGGGDACVLVLPCRHLCLCRACEAGAEVCPVCGAVKNASLQVLL